MSPDEPTAPLDLRGCRRVEARSTRGLWLVVGVLLGVLVVAVLVVVRGDDGPVVAAAPGVAVEPVAASHGSSPRRAPTAAEVADALFVADLDARGASYGSRDDAIAAGRNVCAFLRRGGTESGARLLALPYRQYSPADAVTVIRAASRAYCPERGGAATR